MEKGLDKRSEGGMYNLLKAQIPIFIRCLPSLNVSFVSQFLIYLVLFGYFQWILHQLHYEVSHKPDGADWIINKLPNNVTW